MLVKYALRYCSSQMIDYSQFDNTLDNTFSHVLDKMASAFSKPN